MAMTDYQSGETGLTQGTINTPDLSAALKPRNRAIKDAKQARSIITSLEMASRERNLKNARIMAKYNAERPYNPGALEAEGLAWKSNFSSRPLPMLIDKVAPRFVRALDGVKYLTNSSLPDDVPGASVKTEAFRREVTCTVRSKKGWQNLISEVAMENALFGYTCLAQLDEFGWFPRHFRQDCFFAPSGTSQLSNEAQVVVLKQPFLIHELFDLISDKAAAKDAGWNLPNTVLRINNAMPADRRSGQIGWERVYEDLIRESNVGSSYEAGALVVNVWHVLATEIDGKVSHYILSDTDWSSNKSRGTWSNGNDGGYSHQGHVHAGSSFSDDGSERHTHGSSKDGDMLFEREDEFETMADACGFFSFQSANGKLHGSKGIGREVYSIAAMLDRSRNEVVDRLNLSGKLIIQSDDKALRRFKMSVVGNALLIGQGYQISERKLDAGVEPFMMLDEFLTRLLDQMAGATTPKAFEGERVTKAAVDLFASREEESRDNIIARFLGQFAEIMSTIQKRLCDPHTNDKDARAMQKRLLEVMDRKELKQLSEYVVAETVRDYTDMERQQITLIAQEARGNPLYNQKEIERRKLTAQINEEFANAVLLPDEDPTATAEQTRMQKLELLILAGQGAEVPVSPRDNHLIHLQVLQPAMEAAATAAVTEGVAGLQVLDVMYKHAQEHFQMAEQAGIPKDGLAPVKELLSKLGTAIKQMDKLESENVKNAEQAPVAVPAEMGGPPPTPTMGAALPAA